MVRFQDLYQGHFSCRQQVLILGCGMATGVQLLTSICNLSRNMRFFVLCCRLCELNVLRQVFHVATSPVVAGAWAEGQELHLYGVIYDLADGHLRKLAGPVSGDDEYQHSLEGFVTEEGLKVTRCPQTSLLRVSSNNTDEQDHAVFEASALVGSDGDMLYPLPLGTTPSELVSSINNINLQVCAAAEALNTCFGRGSICCGYLLLLASTLLCWVLLASREPHSVVLSSTALLESTCCFMQQQAFGVVLTTSVQLCRSTAGVHFQAQAMGPRGVALNQQRRQRPRHPCSQTRQQPW
eukprot:GHUV01053467.1.p1 GENE.GHUV01053467.1~~GHUV01053467.1.p1  ORF type:complete len:295 (+),score=72.26 GHUV01053467.1:1635-2519(+)